MSIRTDISFLKQQLTELKASVFASYQTGLATTSLAQIQKFTKDFSDFSLIEQHKSLHTPFASWVALLKEKLGEKKQTKRAKAKVLDCEIPTNKSSIRVVDEQTRIIRRFLSLHKRNKTGKDLLNLKNAIDRYVKHGLINCQSKYKQLIIEIDKRLVNALQQVDDLSHHLTMEIGDQPLICQLVQVAGSSQVYPSIRLLNRYLGVHGRKKSEVGDKATRLLTAIERAIKKQTVRKEDPFFAELMAAQKELKKFLASKNDKALAIKPTSLAGLHGLMGGLGFTTHLGATVDEEAAIWEFLEKENDYKAQKKSLDQIIANQEVDQTVLFDKVKDETVWFRANSKCNAE